MRPVIALFAKAPRPGRVKTRLAPIIGPSAAADLYHCFVRDTLELLLRFKQYADVELHTDVLSDSWAEYEVTQRLQAQGELGARLLQALAALLGAGHPSVTIVGADSPGLPEGHLEAVMESASDVTLGPTEDGGYYAIRCLKIHDAMFGGVLWSTAQAAHTTIQAAEACGLTTAMGPGYFDIDEPADLVRLARGAMPEHTRAWIAANRDLLEGVPEISQSNRPPDS